MAISDNESIAKMKYKFLMVSTKFLVDFNVFLEMY